MGQSISLRFLSDIDQNEHGELKLRKDKAALHLMTYGCCYRAENCEEALSAPAFFGSQCLHHERIIHNLYMWYPSRVLLEKLP